MIQLQKFQIVLMNVTQEVKGLLYSPFIVLCDLTDKKDLKYLRIVFLNWWVPFSVGCGPLPRKKTK